MIFHWLFILFETQHSLNPTTMESREPSFQTRGELSYLAPLGSENISAPYFKQSKTTPPSPKTEITNILFYILNFAPIIKFKM